MGSWPSCSRVILLATLSTQATCTPNSAKQAPVTKPTYPVPITQMCIRFIPYTEFVPALPGYPLASRACYTFQLIAIHTVFTQKPRRDPVNLYNLINIFGSYFLYTSRPIGKRSKVHNTLWESVTFMAIGFWQASNTR